MNDRFKFRVVYYNDVEKKYFIFEPDLISADGTAKAYAYGESGVDEYYDTVTLNQCTGLEDKNGKLIYEGDIVKFFCDSDYCSDGYHKCQYCSDGEIAEIIFDRDAAMFKYSSIRDVCSLDDNIDTEINLEVIGNIYENADLLGRTQKMNNYEKIKAMTLDEMAEFLDRKSNHECCYHHYNGSCIGHDCIDGIKQWLKSESEE